MAVCLLSDRECSLLLQSCCAVTHFNDVVIEGIEVLSKLSWSDAQLRVDIVAFGSLQAVEEGAQSGELAVDFDTRAPYATDPLPLF